MASYTRQGGEQPIRRVSDLRRNRLFEIDEGLEGLSPSVRNSMTSYDNSRMMPSQRHASASRRVPLSIDAEPAYEFDDELFRPSTRMHSRPTTVRYSTPASRLSIYRRPILKASVSYLQNSYIPYLIFFLGLLCGMVLIVVGPVSIRWIFSLFVNLISALTQQEITNILQNITSIITV